MKRKPIPRPAADVPKHSKAKIRKEALRLHVTASKAIKWKCRNCSNNQRLESANCRVLTCSLWPFRPGHKITPEELVYWENKFCSDPLNREILNEAKLEELGIKKDAGGVEFGELEDVFK